MAKGYNAKSKANLRPPMKKGEPSRNPEGKNGQEWRKTFREYFEELDIDLEANEKADIKAVMDGDKKALARCSKAMRIKNVWRALYRRALSGEKSAQEFIVEQMQGMSAQAVEVSGPGGVPVSGGPMVILKMPDNGRGPKDQDPDDVGDAPPPASPDASEPPEGT